MNYSKGIVSYWHALYIVLKSTMFLWHIRPQRPHGVKYNQDITQ